MTDEDEMMESDPVTCPAHYAGDGIVDCKRAIRSMLAGYDHMASLLKARESIDNALRGMGEDI